MEGKTLRHMRVIHKSSTLFQLLSFYHNFKKNAELFFLLFHQSSWLSFLVYFIGLNRVPFMLKVLGIFGLLHPSSSIFYFSLSFFEISFISLHLSDGFWTLRHACWKCEPNDRWECKACIWRWWRSLSQESCYSNLSNDCKGVFSVTLHYSFGLCDVYSNFNGLSPYIWSICFRKLSEVKEKNQNIRTGGTMTI